MSVKITFEVENCLDCHYKYDNSNSCRISCREIPKKGVPDWCPFKLKQYFDLISTIEESTFWKEQTEIYSGNYNDLPSLYFGLKHIMITIINAGSFLHDLANSDLKNFLYSEYNHSIERDIYLMTIVAMLRELDSSPEVSAKMARRKFLAHSELSEEDQDIIIDAILHWMDGPVLIEQMDTYKERFKVHRKKPVLDTSTAIKISLYLASVLNITNRAASPYRPHGCYCDEYYTALKICQALGKDSKAAFHLTYNPNLGKKGIIGSNPKNAAELHYTTGSEIDLSVFKLWPELLTVPRSIAKDFLGFRSFKVFVNGEEVNISRFLRKKSD